MNAVDNNREQTMSRQGYMHTVYVGDYSVNLWVNCDPNAPLGDRIRAQAAALKEAFDLELAQYGMKCAKIEA